DDLAHLLLEPRHRNGDVALAHAEEPTDADDRVRHRFVGRHDQIADLADLVARVVVDVLPENLLLRAPPLRDFLDLRYRDAAHARAGGLRHRIGRGGRDDEAHEHHDYCFHCVPPVRCYSIAVRAQTRAPATKDYASLGEVGTGP